jgi:hypothetical protein
MPMVGMPIMILFSVVIIAVPGVMGYNVKELRQGDVVTAVQHEPV